MKKRVMYSQSTIFFVGVNLQKVKKTRLCGYFYIQSIFITLYVSNCFLVFCFLPEGMFECCLKVVKQVFVFIFEFSDPSVEQSVKPPGIAQDVTLWPIKELIKTWMSTGEHTTEAIVEILHVICSFQFNALSVWFQKTGKNHGDVTPNPHSPPPGWVTERHARRYL